MKPSAKIRKRMANLREMFKRKNPTRWALMDEDEREQWALEILIGCILDYLDEKQK